MTKIQLWKIQNLIVNHKSRSVKSNTVDISSALMLLEVLLSTSIIGNHRCHIAWRYQDIKVRNIIVVNYWIIYNLNFNKRLPVETLLWSLEFVIQINLEQDTIAVWNLNQTRHHCSLKLESKIEHISRDKFAFIKFFPVICAHIKSDGGALPKSYAKIRNLGRWSETADVRLPNNNFVVWVWLQNESSMKVEKEEILVAKMISGNQKLEETSSRKLLPSSKNSYFSRLILKYDCY